MSRGACTFRQTDLTRALKATQAAGIEVQRIEIDKQGKIVVVAGKSVESRLSEVNEWDSAS